MGQYHLVVNLDKRQFLDPHKFGDGLKLMEFGNSGFGGTMTALSVLLGVSSREGGRGGGDIHIDREAIVGSWGGDRIAIVGDYAEREDLPAEFHAEAIYLLCRLDKDGESREESVKWAREHDDHELADLLESEAPYTDVSDVVRSLLAEANEATYWRTNWGGVTRTTPYADEPKPDHVMEEIS